jgi:hypothetical protein
MFNFVDNAKGLRGIRGVNDYQVLMLSEKNILHPVNISDRSFI